MNTVLNALRDFQAQRTPSQSGKHFELHAADFLRERLGDGFPGIIFNPFHYPEFAHPQVFQYRTHQQKCRLLCRGPLLPLHEFLQKLHPICPIIPLMPGPKVFRVLGTMPVQPMHVTGHPRSNDAIVGRLRYANEFSSEHSQVQYHMLVYDNSTIATDIPVWMHAWESGALPIQTPNGECLCGHIDLVSIERQRITVWDYRPRTATDKRVAFQVALHAYMLSRRTGIPLELFDCGYFDENDCFQFTPAIQAFASMSLGRLPRSRSRAMRSAPDLGFMRITPPHGSMNATSALTWHLFMVVRLSISMIARYRCLTEDTVYSHLEKALACGVLDIRSVVHSGSVTRISSVWNELLPRERNLQNLNEAMREELPYGLLSIVVKFLELVSQNLYRFSIDSEIFQVLDIQQTRQIQESWHPTYGQEWSAPPQAA